MVNANTLWFNHSSTFFSQGSGGNIQPKPSLRRVVDSFDTLAHLPTRIQSQLFKRPFRMACFPALIALWSRSNHFAGESRGSAWRWTDSASRGISSSCRSFWQGFFFYFMSQKAKPCTLLLQRFRMLCTRFSQRWSGISCPIFSWKHCVTSVILFIFLHISLLSYSLDVQKICSCRFW